MSRTKEFFHEEIEEQFRRDLIEEPFPRPGNHYNFVISVSAPQLSDIYTALHNIYQEIKAGYLEGGQTFPSKREGTITYGFRKL